MSTEFENQNPQVEQTEETGVTFVEPKIVPQVATMWNNTKWGRMNREQAQSRRANAYKYLHYTYYIYYIYVNHG